jgi:hypothetical protein
MTRNHVWVVIVGVLVAAAWQFEANGLAERLIAVGAAALVSGSYMALERWRRGT